MFITAFLWAASSLPHLQRFRLLISTFSLEIRLLGKSNSSPETHSCNQWSAGWRNKAAIIIAPNIFLPFNHKHRQRCKHFSPIFIFAQFSSIQLHEWYGKLAYCCTFRSAQSMQTTPPTHTYLKCFSVKGENFSTLWISFKIFDYLWTICKVVFLKIEWIIFQKFLLYFWVAKS